MKNLSKALYLLAWFDYFADKYDADNSMYLTEYRSYKMDSLFISNRNLMTEEEVSKLIALCQNDKMSQFFLRYNIAEYIPVEDRKELHAL